jgi:hypothetical protein
MKKTLLILVILSLIAGCNTANANINKAKPADYEYHPLIDEEFRLSSDYTFKEFVDEQVLNGDEIYFRAYGVEPLGAWRGIHFSDLSKAKLKKLRNSFKEDLWDIQIDAEEINRRSEEYQKIHDYQMPLDKFVLLNPSKKVGVSLDFELGEIRFFTTYDGSSWGGVSSIVLTDPQQMVELRRLLLDAWSNERISAPLDMHPPFEA